MIAEQPKYLSKASELPSSPIRLGLQGLPGIGKTFGALTFPNVVYADLDNKMAGWRKTPD